MTQRSIAYGQHDVTTMTFCSDCDQPLTAEEAHYYEHRCERCERIWFYRIENWRRGAEDAEFDEMFGLNS